MFKFYIASTWNINTARCCFIKCYYSVITLLLPCYYSAMTVLLHLHWSGSKTPSLSRLRPTPDPYKVSWRPSNNLSLYEEGEDGGIKGRRRDKHPASQSDGRKNQQSYPSRLDLLHVQRQEELGDALQPHPLLGHPQVAHPILEKKRGEETEAGRLKCVELCFVFFLLLFLETKPEEICLVFSVV